MSLHIEDGGGSGQLVKVSSEGRLNTVSVNQELQHYTSISDGNSYQVIGDFASLNNSTFPILHIQNTDTTRNMVVSFIRMQIIGAAGGNFNASTYYLGS